MQMTSAVPLPEVVTPRRRRRWVENIFWYLLLTLIAMITAFPFVWVFATSLKGAEDPVFSVPPVILPGHPTLDNFNRVLTGLPIGRFFANSVLVAIATVGLNLLFTALAAYPLAKMRFKGRDVIFYILLATFIIPPQLISIPSYVLAVNTFRYYDSLYALIFPSLATVFNIFMLRQAFKAVPNDLIEAGRIDGASELRIWWSILLPVIRPSLATVAIITFVNTWNDFYWPSLMLHTRDRMTLQVGLAAMQGMFTSDMRGIAAGVTITVVPILIFFVLTQKYFVKGLSGAVKG